MNAHCGAIPQSHIVLLQYPYVGLEGIPDIHHLRTALLSRFSERRRYVNRMGSVVDSDVGVLIPISHRRRYLTEERRGLQKWGHKETNS